VQTKTLPAVLLTAAVGLSACGSSSDSSDTPTPTTTTSSSSATTKTPAGGLTPPGTKLALGAEATLGWVPLSVSGTGGDRPATKVKVKVLSIEQGKPGDFDQVGGSDTDKTAVPFYVKVHITSEGRPAKPTDDPDISLRALDDRGQPQSSVTFIGDFEKCSDNKPPQPFESGASYDSCLTYLVPGGGSIQQIAWRDGASSATSVTPYFEHPVVWTAN
jgi:hypothetical protein